MPTVSIFSCFANTEVIVLQTPSLRLYGGAQLRLTSTQAAPAPRTQKQQLGKPMPSANNKYALVAAIFCLLLRLTLEALI